jgi:hypothetical protein
MTAILLPLRRNARGLLGMESVAPDVRNVALTIAIQSPADEDAVVTLKKMPA